MRILLVDDQATNRALLAYLLEEDGHEVIEASSGEEGLDQYDKHSPDLILMDVIMPGMDGYETAERIKARTQAYVPIIFLTALSDDLALSKCIESGGDDFLIKPVNKILLAAKIKAHERIRELNRELVEKNQELERLHSLFTQEYELAEYVFETAISNNEEYANINCFLSPMGGFSGDIILATKTNRNSMFLMLGDFTGHGLPAALGALPVVQVFEYLAMRGSTLGELATEINHTLFKYLPSNMFCAANIIEISDDGSQVSCWLGGLPDMYLVDEQGLIKGSIQSNHTPLGVLSEQTFKSDVIDFTLVPGERLFTYSDGVTDCRNLYGEMMGHERFELLFNGEVQGHALFQHLVDEMAAFSQGRPQEDDISMLEVMAKPNAFH